MAINLDNMLAEAESAVSRSRELEHQIATLEATGTAADGRVTVTAAAGGRISGVTIEPKAMRLASEDLAQAILDASREAQEELNRQMQELVKGFWGETSMFGKLASGAPIDPYELFESQGINVPPSLRGQI
jgi:DNA-binding protein YbaB